MQRLGVEPVEIPCLQEMASVYKENCHDHAFRILWINTLPLDVTSNQRISLVTELLPDPQTVLLALLDRWGSGGEFLFIRLNRPQNLWGYLLFNGLG